MASEEIRIPVLSLLKDSRVLFFNLHKFVEALEKMYDRSQDDGITSSNGNFAPEMKFVEDSPAGIVKEAVTVLRDMSSLEGEYLLGASRKFPLVTPELLSELTERKRSMKKDLNLYTKVLTKLKECQTSCWRSQAKEEKYRLMLDAAEASLKYNSEDKGELTARIAAIGKIKEDLSSRVKQHDCNRRDYALTIKREMTVREELARDSLVLKHHVTAAIKASLKATLNLHAGEDVNLDAISRCIYGLISHTYKLEIPPSMDESTRVIQHPDIQSSLYNPKNAKRIIKSVSKEVEELTPPVPASGIEECVNATDSDRGDERKDSDIPSQSEVAVKKNGFFASLIRFISKKGKQNPTK